MKISNLIWLPAFLYFAIPAKSQTVTDFIRMMNTQFEPYMEEELMASDSLGDIKSEYYDRGIYDGYPGNSARKRILGQVAAFANDDGNKTIAESFSKHNFACMTNKIRFFHFDGTRLNYELNSEYYIPFINIENLLTPKIIAVLKNYFQIQVHKNYSIVRAFISSAYDDVRYELSRFGKSIILHLDYCGQFGEEKPVSKEGLNRLEAELDLCNFFYSNRSKQFTTNNKEAIKLDGRINEKGWMHAKKYKLSSGGQLYVLCKGQVAYVGIKGNCEGLAHVYLSVKDSVKILHASTALGEQLYTHKQGIWKLKRKFNWEIREFEYSDKLQKIQTAYYAKNGWCSNNNKTGEKGTLEFKINLKKFGNGRIKFAVVFTPDAKSLSYYPIRLKDDSLLESLVSGGSPDSLDFKTSKWIRMKC